MTITSFPTAEIPRDRYTRPLVVPPAGGARVPYTRATTLADACDEKYKLSLWLQRMVAVGLSQRRDLLLAITPLAPDLMLPTSEVPDEAKKKADSICERAVEAARGHAAASIGTSMHTITERHDRGLPLGVLPTEAQRDLDAYVEATQRLRALHIEQFSVNDELEVGGTPDRIVEFEGRNYIADLKTGSIEFSALKIAVQLAIYAHSDLYDVSTDERTPLPNVDQQRAIVIHLPEGSGECSLLWVDIGRGWDAVQTCVDVRRLRKIRDWMTPLSSDYAQPYLDANVDRAPEPVTAPVTTLPASFQSIANAIASATTVDELATLWRTYSADWNDDLTSLAAARKALLIGGLT